MPLLPESEEPGQAELVQAYRLSGDNRHFEALYRSSRRRVYAICLKLLREEQAALDATHESFLKAYQQFSDLRGVHFSAWVAKIAANLCLNLIRQSAAHARLAPSQPPRRPGDAESEVLAAEETGAAREVLGSLNPAQRKVLVLHYLDGYSYEEISRLTGFDPGQVRSHIQNGRRNFRIRWSEKYGSRRV